MYSDIEKIRYYQHEVYDHLMQHIDKGYKTSTPSETAIVIALSELYNELCDVIKSVEKNHDHDDQKSRRAAVHDDGAGMIGAPGRR